MDSISEQEILKRRPINLTIRTDILNEAKSLKLNASKAAETGIIAAIKIAREEEWLEANSGAILAHNKRIEKNGPLLTPNWASE